MVCTVPISRFRCTLVPYKKRTKNCQLFSSQRTSFPTIKYHTILIKTRTVPRIVGDPRVESKTLAHFNEPTRGSQVMGDPRVKSKTLAHFTCNEPTAGRGWWVTRWSKAKHLHILMNWPAGRGWPEGHWRKTLPHFIELTDPWVGIQI